MKKLIALVSALVVGLVISIQAANEGAQTTQGGQPAVGQCKGPCGGTGICPNGKECPGKNGQCPGLGQGSSTNGACQMRGPCGGKGRGPGKGPGKGACPMKDGKAAT